VSSGGCDLERLHALALGVNVYKLAWLHAERWAVDALTVYEDVTVNYHLACL
jgi:hypothetical protein